MSKWIILNCHPWWFVFFSTNPISYHCYECNIMNNRWPLLICRRWHLVAVNVNIYCKAERIFFLLLLYFAIQKKSHDNVKLKNCLEMSDGDENLQTMVTSWSKSVCVSHSTRYFECCLLEIFWFFHNRVTLQ